jgi:hypothetical protein
MIILILIALACIYKLCLWSARPDELVRSIDDGTFARARRSLR